MATEKSPLVVPGYVSAVIFPIVGFVVGIVMLTKSGRTVRHGAAVMCVAICAAIGWAAFIAHERQHSAPKCSMIDSAGDCLYYQ